MTSARLRTIEPLVFAIPAALCAGAAVLLSYATKPYLPLVGVVVAGGLLVALWRPPVALYGAVALVPLELFRLPLVGVNLTPAKAMFVVAGLAWAARRVADGRVPLVASPLTKPLLLLLALMTPGLVIAPHPSSVLKTLGLWTALFFVYQMIVAEGDARIVRRLLTLLAFAGAIVGVVAVVRSGGGAQQQLQDLGELASGRATGAFTEPNQLASFLALSLPAALVLALRGRRLLRPAAILAFGAAFAGLALSLSRGGLFAAVGAIGALLAWPPFRRVAVVAAVVVLVAVIVRPAPVGDVKQVDTVLNRVSSVSYSVSGRSDPRFMIWQGTLRMIGDHPLFGVGASSYVDAAPRYGIMDPVTDEVFEHAHNIPLTIAAELGLAGFAAFLWVVGVLAVVLFRACRGMRGEARGWAFALMAAFVSLALQGLVDYTLETSVIAALVFTLMGCAVVLARSAPDTEPEARPS
jgi:O-antigen ligase